MEKIQPFKNCFINLKSSLPKFKEWHQKMLHKENVKQEMLSGKFSQYNQQPFEKYKQQIKKCNWFLQ